MLLKSVRLRGFPRFATSDRDSKFLSHVRFTLWKHFGANLKFSNIAHLLTEATNRTLRKLILCVCQDKPKQEFVRTQTRPSLSYVVYMELSRHFLNLDILLKFCGSNILANRIVEQEQSIQEEMKKLEA